MKNTKKQTVSIFKIETTDKKTYLFTKEQAFNDFVADFIQTLHGAEYSKDEISQAEYDQLKQAGKFEDVKPTQGTQPAQEPAQTEMETMRQALQNMQNEIAALKQENSTLKAKSNISITERLQRTEQIAELEKLRQRFIDAQSKLNKNPIIVPVNDLNFENPANYTLSLNLGTETVFKTSNDVLIYAAHQLLNDKIQGRINQLTEQILGIEL